MFTPVVQPEAAVSVVIPVFRNAGTLSLLLHRISSALGTLRDALEVIFVDDASPDNSASVLKILSRQDARVSALILHRNLGQHHAILVGLRYARGEKTVIMDADLQDPPEAIPRLLAELGTNADAAFAGRRGDYEAPARLLTSRMFKWLQHWLAGVPYDAGTFVVISRELRTRLLQMPRPFGSVVAMIGCAGLPITSVAVPRSRRHDGESAYRWHGRLGSGLRAILWVLYWKLVGSWAQSGGGAYGRNAAEAEAAVEEFVGQRFRRNLQIEG